MGKQKLGFFFFFTKDEKTRKEIPILNMSLSTEGRVWCGVVAEAAGPAQHSAEERVSERSHCGS